MTRDMPRCLIVDDDRDGREGYAEYLRVYGFDVDECDDGESALLLLSRRIPDILLLDLQLPGLSGWDLLKEIRSDKRLRHIPVIAISACVFPEDRRRADEAGCNVFLSKPSVPADVLAEIVRLLRLRVTPQPVTGMPDAGQ